VTLQSGSGVMVQEAWGRSLGLVWDLHGLSRAVKLLLFLARFRFPSLVCCGCGPRRLGGNTASTPRTVFCVA